MKHNLADQVKKVCENTNVSSDEKCYILKDMCIANEMLYDDLLSLYPVKEGYDKYLDMNLILGG